jgi:hypothetical protein
MHSRDGGKKLTKINFNRMHTLFVALSRKGFAYEAKYRAILGKDSSLNSSRPLLSIERWKETWKGMDRSQQFKNKQRAIRGLYFTPTTLRILPHSRCGTLLGERFLSSSTWISFMISSGENDDGSDCGARKGHFRRVGNWIWEGESRDASQKVSVLRLQAVIITSYERPRKITEICRQNIIEKKR